MDSVKWRAGLLSLCLGLLALVGCENDDPNVAKPFDYGGNDVNVYAALGDSITLGIEPFSGTPYPDQLAAMLGKTVINVASDGEFSYQGAARVGQILANRKPGHLLYMYGANDLIHGGDVPGIVEELRSIARAAKANQTMPVIATLPPMTRHAMHFYDATLVLNSQIRAMAAEEDMPVADYESVVIGREDSLLDDGLHPNQEGNRRLAEVFAGAVQSGSSISFDVW